MVIVGVVVGVVGFVVIREMVNYKVFLIFVIVEGVIGDLVCFKMFEVKCLVLESVSFLVVKSVKEVIEIVVDVIEKYLEDFVENEIFDEFFLDDLGLI